VDAEVEAAAALWRLPTVADAHRLLTAFARLCLRRFAGGQHSQIVQQARRSPSLKRFPGVDPDQ
jgi:hypothetical protein